LETGQKVPVIVPALLIVAAVAGELAAAIVMEPVAPQDTKANPDVANACRATTEPWVMKIVPVGLIVPEPDGLTTNDTANCLAKRIV
jgi:hypothetical protein